MNGSPIIRDIALITGADKEIVQNRKEFLEQHGFAVKTFSAVDEYLAEFKNGYKTDLVISAVNFPDDEGGMG